jgi:hypothetical protein
MAYRDDFYNPRNIIGYTGDLLHYPTVYFRRGPEYGHITQHHRYAHNVGREQVGWDASYYIANHYHKGRIVNTEWERGILVHHSRNPLITSDRFHPGDLTILRQAIIDFPDEKLMYVDCARRQVGLKARLHGELRWQFKAVKHHRYDLFGGRDPNPGATRVIDRQILLAGGRRPLLVRR